MYLFFSNVVICVDLNFDHFHVSDDSVAGFAVILQRGSANQGSQEMKGPEILSWFGFPADESVYISLKFFSSHHCFMFYILLNRLHNLLELSDAFAITCVNACQFS